jgi:hypothetical protein
MIDTIKEKPFIGLGLTLAFGLAIGLILSFTLFSSNDGGEMPSAGTLLMLATGHSAISAGNSEQRVYVSEGQLWEETLPLTLNEARNLRWKKEVSCVSGVGHYSRKNAAKSAAAESYSLIFDSKDKVIGVYFYSENQQDSPWQQMQSAGPFPYPHWGLHIFFQDSTNACL